jgi:hypothetical protein
MLQKHTPNRSVNSIRCPSSASAAMRASGEPGPERQVRDVMYATVGLFEPAELVLSHVTVADIDQ